MAKKIEVTLVLNTRDFDRKIRRATGTLNRFERSAGGGAAGMSRLGQSIAPLIAASGGAALLAKRFGTTSTSINNLNVKTRENSATFNKFFEEIDNGSKTTEGFKQRIKGAGAGVGNFGKTIAKQLGGMAAFVAKFLLLSVAIGAVIGSFNALRNAVKQAAVFEDVQITLQNITGSAEAGAFALDMITAAAEKLPFAFQELATAAPVLATVSGTLGELEENMFLAADIAANFGIPFEQAASSLQRSFSAGAGAADVFREKGVLAAAGFEAGVSVSIEETQKKIKAFGVTIEGAAQTLNTTFSGATSQAGDAITLFNKAVGEAAAPFFKAFLLETVGLFRDNRDAADEMAQQIGTNLVNGFEAAVIGGAYLFDILEGLKNGFIEIITLGGALDGAYAAIGDLLKDLGVSIGGGLEDIFDFDKVETVKKFFEGVRFSAEEIKAAGDEVKEGAKEIDKGFEIILGGGTSASEGIGSVKDALTLFKEELSKAKGTVEEYNALMLKLEELYKTSAIGLEEYIRLKRDLDEVFSQNEGMNNFLDTLGTAQVTLSTDLANAFLNGKSAMESFRNFFKTLITQILADILRLQIIQPILGSIMSPFGFGFGSGGSIVKLPGKALGGPVMSNKPYVVGENGPEVFVPNNTGSIIPNNRLGGSSTTVNYNIQAVDAPSFQALVASNPEFIFSVTEAGRRRIPGVRL